jgi:ribosomal protein L15
MVETKTELDQQNKEILDKLPQKQLKRMSNMSRVNRTRKIFNMLSMDEKQKVLRCGGDPKKVMEIINGFSEETKKKIKEIGGDLLE